jgi:hypothetical protein
VQTLEEIPIEVLTKMNLRLPSYGAFDEGKKNWGCLSVHWWANK